MTELTEGRHAAEFILSEANGSRSRENGTLKSGDNVVAGEILETSAGEYTAWVGGTITAIAIAAVDASDAAQPIAVLVRDAEVNLHALEYGDTTDTPEASAISGLETLGIIARA